MVYGWETMAPDAEELLMRQRKNCGEGDCENGALLTEYENEIKKLRALLREVLDDTPMYRIDRMTEEKIRAALPPENWLDDLSRAEDKLISSSAESNNCEQEEGA